MSGGMSEDQSRSVYSLFIPRRTWLEQPRRLRCMSERETEELLWNNLDCMLQHVAQAAVLFRNAARRNRRIPIQTALQRNVRQNVQTLKIEVLKSSAAGAHMQFEGAPKESRIMIKD